MSANLKGMKMKSIRYGILTAAMLLVWCATSQAGSIWAKRSTAGKSPYADDKAIQIGDVLTIVISEEHKVDNKVKSDYSKTTSDSLTFDGAKNKVGNLPELPTVGVDAKSSRSNGGKADYKDERSIEDSITVIVEDIHPNGNLVVLGTRTREISGDKQTIQVSGIVRPSDISYDNSISSKQVANFQLVTISDGATKDYSNPGWFSKFMGWIWPF
jgi:flagellar L-ring protein precursor FlgH